MVETVWEVIDRLLTRLARSDAVNVNSPELRSLARDAAQFWFRSERPNCLALGVGEVELVDMDAQFQYLLTLSQGRNNKRSYLSTLRALKRARPQLEGRTEMLRGAATRPASDARLTATELGILTTLDKMLPHAARSYQQVLDDLAAPIRQSYRGTATELREVVREVLDHLAPDDAVMKSPGFKLEKDRQGPTMKQKARFILKARGLGETSRTAPEQAVNLLEEQIAGIARSVYERGSASTHASTLKAQVRSFKGYADAVLAELLQVYADPETST